MREVKPKKVNIGECVICHQTKAIFCSHKCSSCYQRERSEALRGDCPGCGKKGMRLLARGMCFTCLPELRGVSYTKSRRIRTETPAELAAAKARERDFLDVVLPAVRSAAAKAFRRWSQEGKEEGMAEATALAWRHFVRMLADGYEPLDSAGYVAKVIVKAVKGFQRLTGKMSGVDALSLRTRIDKDLEVVTESQARSPFPEHHGWEGFLYSAGGKPADPAATAFNFEEWKAGLPSGLQEFVDYLTRQNDVADVADHFDLTPATVQGLRDNLCSRYLEYVNS